MSDGDQMKKFLFVDDAGNIDVELWVEATDEKEARKLAWERLTPEQRDACGCLDCVDLCGVVPVTPNADQAPQTKEQSDEI